MGNLIVSQKDLATKCTKITTKVLSFFRACARKKWPLRGSNRAAYRFQVSGFGCQGTEVLNPDTSYEHSWNSEPQNIEQEISNDEVWNRCAQSFFKNNNDRIPYFDIRYSLFQSFFFDQTDRFGGQRRRRTLNPEPLYETRPRWNS